MSLWKNISDKLSVFVYLSFKCNSLFEILVVGIYFLMKGLQTVLCFKSVMWNICLICLCKSLVCSIVRVELKFSIVYKT